MNIKKLSLSVLALSLALSQSVFANEFCKQKKDWIVKISEKLGLNAAQKSKIKDLADQAMVDVKAKREDMRMIRMHLNEAYTNHTIDPTKLDEFIGQQQQVKDALVKLRAKERYDIYMELNDNQKEKMNKMIAEWSKSHDLACDKK